MITSAVFPARYIQGCDAIRELPKHLSQLGDSCLLIVDPGIASWARPLLTDILQESIEYEWLDFSGEATEAAMGHAAELLRESHHAIVVGIGGGKAIDTAKGAAHFVCGTRVVAIPTIAASDAPCSKNAVVYTPEHTVARDIHGRCNPDLVLVDTAIIAKAPSRFLSAGIADALATWLEAESAMKTRCENFTGYSSTLTAFTVARLCYDTLLEYGALALAHCDQELVTPALEHVVEAATLMSTIGFESCGLGAAHGFHQGISEWEETHDRLHGEKVAFGLLASLFLTDKPVETIQSLYQFACDVRLPLTLSDLGVENYDEKKLRIAVERMLRPGECTFNEPVMYSERDYMEAFRAADAYGHQLKSSMAFSDKQ